MASTSTYKELQDRVLSTLGTSETADRNIVKTNLNDSFRDIWRSYTWWERRKWAWAYTVAPYSTGTITTTKADTAVTGSGTTFPTASASRPYKFASGYGEPWYEVTTRTNGTALVLDRDWATTSLSGSGYVLYDDRIILASDVDVLLTDQIWLASTSTGKLVRMRLSTEAELPWASGSGTPWWFVITENDSSGFKRLRLGPVTPDDTYAIRYSYLKDYPVLSGDSDTSDLPEHMMDVAIEGTLYRSYKEEPWRDTDLSERAEASFGRLLRGEIARAMEEYPLTLQMRTFDNVHTDGVAISWKLPSTS